MDVEFLLHTAYKTLLLQQLQRNNLRINKQIPETDKLYADIVYKRRATRPVQYITIKPNCHNRRLAQYQQLYNNQQ